MRRSSLKIASGPGTGGRGAVLPDRELAAKGLNQFGDPQDTVYAGGTPLFDEKTGRAVPREQYVFARHPEIARACGADGGP